MTSEQQKLWSLLQTCSTHSQDRGFLLWASCSTQHQRKHGLHNDKGYPPSVLLNVTATFHMSLLMGTVSDIYHYFVLKPGDRLHSPMLLTSYGLQRPHSSHRASHRPMALILLRAMPHGGDPWLAVHLKRQVREYHEGYNTGHRLGVWGDHSRGRSAEAF